MPPFAALLADWALTALWPLVAKSGTRLYDGVLFSTAGLLVGLVLLLPWLLAEGRLGRLFSRRLGPSLAVMGFFSGCASAVYVCAAAYTTPANAAIMAQVEVLYSALLSALFLKERITARQAAGSLLVVAGTALIVSRDLSSPRWKGDLMILATPWMYQLSHIVSKRLPKDLDPLTATGGRIVYGLAAMAPFCAWTLARGGAWNWSREGLGLVLVQGALMSSVNFLLWYQAILNMDLAKATTVLLSYPALTLAFSWALGREAASPVQLAGLAVTLTGAYLVSRLVLEPAAVPVPET